MIIFEGPDGGGKSRLIERIMGDVPLPKAPRFATSLGGPKENLGLLVFEDLKNQAQMDFPQIYDRHPLVSEYIYGHTIPGRAVNPYFLYESARTLRQTVARSALVVWCLPPLHYVVKAAQNGQHMPGVADNIEKIYEGYCIARVQWPGESVTYDYSRGGYNSIVQSVMRHATEWQFQGKQLLNVG